MFCNSRSYLDFSDMISNALNMWDGMNTLMVLSSTV